MTQSKIAPCAKDNNWVDFVYEKGEAEKHYKPAAHYASLASIDPNEMFFELALKITFPYHGRETTFIKYVILDKSANKHTTAIKAMVNVNGRYKVSKTLIDGNLGFALIFIGGVSTSFYCQLN